MPRTACMQLRCITTLAFFASAACLSLRPLGSQLAPRRRVVVFECEHGTDKIGGENGHRADTAPLLRALSDAGFEAEPVFFRDREESELRQRLLRHHKPVAFVSRVDPGVYPHCTMSAYRRFLERLYEGGIAAFNHPKDMENLGQKKSLLKLLGMPLSVSEMHLYSHGDEATFPTRFAKHLAASGSRVLKQNMGSKGEGVWLIKAADPRSPMVWGNDTFVHLIEAADNSKQTLRLHNLTQLFQTQYLAAPGNFLVEMPFLPRIQEGEIRLVLSGRRVIHVVEKIPAKVLEDEAGFSANLDAGAKHVWHRPEAFPDVVQPFMRQLDELLQRLDVKDAPILWTADFIRDGPADDTKFVLSEINASCVGFKANPELASELVRSISEHLNKTRPGQDL